MNGLASICFWLAAWLMREKRDEWARAMRAEFQHVQPRERLHWAIGCLCAAIKQRFAPMQTGNFRPARWVMFIEMLGCFGPALLAWYEFTFGPSGVARLNSQVIDKYFLSTPDGGLLLGVMVAFAVTGLIGPIGLFLGLRYVFFGRALYNRALGIVLIAGTGLLCIANTIRLLWTGEGYGTITLELFVLLTLLPVAGILHLMYLAQPRASIPGDARLAAG